MYSQSEEERHILGAVGEPASFLDIGANDGRFASNTLALVERGWAGVLVEASYHAFGNLLKHHGENQKLRLVQAAVGVDHRLVPFWEAGLLSTTEPQNFMNWRGQVQYSEPYLLPQVTVGDLIDAFPSILDGGRLQVVSIDTEGTSVEIFRNWPWDRSKPKVIVLEYDRALEWLIAKAGYLGYDIVYTSKENVVMVDR